MTSYEDLDPVTKYKLIKSKTIKQEINRFESVHPCIYEIYDLLEELQESKISSQIREYVHCIEDSFINSQEWTLTHGIDEIRLGIIGASSSGKSSLIHRYLTGTYIQNEYDEGGRFKKEVNLDGDESHLMLIRDDGSEPPDYQFSNWVDGVIFIFSLENEESLSILYKLHEQLLKHRNQWLTTDLPCILVGTQDYISESNPRVIDDSKARKLAADLKMCSYYETCATYGLNVEKVFQEAAMSLHNYRSKKIIRDKTANAQQRPINMNYPNSGVGTLSKSRPNPNNPAILNNASRFNQSTLSHNNSLVNPPVPPTREASQGFGTMKMPIRPQQQYPPLKSKPLHHSNASSPVPSNTNPLLHQSNNPALPLPPLPNQIIASTITNNTCTTVTATSNNGAVSQQQFQLSNSPSNHFSRSSAATISLRGGDKNPQNQMQDGEIDDKNTSNAPNVTSNVGSGTPNQIRKIRRRSTLFKNDKKTVAQVASTASNMGVGRTIPVKQGNLYKRRGDRALAKDRKKKYVTLTMDARLTYHPNINDYMEDVHGKEIDLSRVTVKIPGVPYRQGTAGTPNMGAGVALSAMKSRNRASDPTGGTGKGLKEMAKKQKKKFISNDSSDSFEFQIVSLDGKQWCFETNSEEDRQDWVKFIEDAILECLQNMEIVRKSPQDRLIAAGEGDSTANDSNHSQRNSQALQSSADTPNFGTSNLASDAESRRTMMQELSAVSGNDFCADCGQSAPNWASLNLGELVCIECSGVHRKLGTHISRVRSLQLDQWAPEWLLVMKSIGNTVANTVWEAAVNVCPKKLKKPEPSSSPAEKEDWIRSKYERRDFLPPLPCQGWSNQQQLIDAISRRDIRQVILCLAVASEAEINTSYTNTDSRAAIHFAAAIGDIVCLQLLLWYRAQIDLKDSSGRNAYFYARMYGKDTVAEFLLKNGATRQNLPPQITNTNNPAPVSNNVAKKQQSLQQSTQSAQQNPHNSASSSLSSNNSAHHLQQQQQQQQVFHNPPPSVATTNTNNNSPKQPFLLTCTSSQQNI